MILNTMDNAFETAETIVKDYSEGESCMRKSYVEETINKQTKN